MVLPECSYKAAEALTVEARKAQEIGTLVQLLKPQLGDKPAAGHQQANLEHGLGPVLVKEGFASWGKSYP